MFSKLKNLLVLTLLISFTAQAAYFPSVAINNYNALGIYNLTPPTLTDGSTANLQLNVNGRLLVQVPQLPTSLGSQLSASSLSVVFASDSAAPLPTGAATAAKQDTGNTSVASIDSKTPALGQALAVSSVPVVLTAAQVTAITPPTTVTVTQATGTNLHTVVDSSALPSGAATSSNQNTEITSLTSIATNTNVGTNGAATSALQTTGNTSLASLVTNQPKADAVPAGGSITVQDTGSTTTPVFNAQSWVTGTPTAGSVAAITLSSIETGMVQISGTWTGTLTSEISVDGGTTWTPHGIHLIGSPVFATAFTGNVIGSLNLGAKTNYRIRATAAMTGTAVVRFLTSNSPSTIYIANGIKISDSTTSTSANVKAASTAAVATDTALVVAVSPNTKVGTTSPVNVTGSGSAAAATVSTVATITAPSNAVGFILMNLDTSSTNMRWAVGRTASATLGQQLQPGRDTGFVPVGANVSIIAESGTCNYDIQWVSQ